ncbi:MAG: PKD domain-containing protein [Methanoregula sp.]
MVSAAPPGTETRISFPADPVCTNTFPSADNGWIVWQESCTGNLHIIAYNYHTGIQLTLPNATLTSSTPNIKGNRVVWRENAGGGLTSLYYTDLTTTTPTSHRLNLPPSWKTNPVVDRDTVVWEDKETSTSPTNPDILMYNITSLTLYNLTPGTADSSQTYPSISGNHVVWLDDRNGQYDIFMNTTYSGWATMNVTPGIPGPEQHRPIINGDRILWFDNSNTLYLNDMTTTTILPSYFTGDKINNVALCSTYVGWKEQTGGISGPWDIFVNNTASSSLPDQITDSGSKRFKGVVSDPVSSPVIITPDSRVIWVDKRDVRANIYMFTYSAPAACPVVQISASPTEGSSPLTVTFNDTSSSSFTHWRWEFGDGSTATSKNTSHQYFSNGIYTARLVAGTPSCRNVSGPQTISVGIPSVEFTGTPVEGIVPLTVAFYGTATGSPTTWLWDFGDGGSSGIRNPSHVYTSGGRYTVNLTATNSYGNGVRSRSGYINARNGLQEYAFTNITGISVSGSGSSQFLTLDKTVIPSYTLSADRKSLTFIPPAGYGWHNITFISADTTGFSEGPITITGRFTSASLTIRDLQPATFSSGIGSNLKMNYHMEIGQYSAPAYLLSRIWEGTLPSDDGLFSNIIHRSGFSEKNVAYTLNITRNNLTNPSRLRLNLSVGSAWLSEPEGIEWGRQHTYVIAMGYDTDGDLKGMVLPAHYTFNDTADRLEFFEAEIPWQYMFLNKYALAMLSGTGNPLQLITLTVTNRANPPEPNNYQPSGSDSESKAGIAAGAGKITSETSTPTPAIPPATVQADPGTSAKIYTNANGVITQATRLTSTDSHAILNITEGIVAKNASGNPLSEITVKALPSGSLPAVPSGSVFTFAGMAYDLGPDDATFSPPVSLSFSLPQEQRGQDYSVKSFDRKSGTWQDLPTTFDAATGTVTAHVSHLCVFALFTEPRVSPVTTPAATPLPVPATPQAKAQPPTTAVSIFSSMMIWIGELAGKNIIFIVAIAIILCLLFYYRRNRWE